MDRFALILLVVALATAASCILGREGGLPVESTGGAGGVAPTGGGGTSSGMTGGGGAEGGSFPSCGQGYECVPEGGEGQLVRRVTEPFGLCPEGWEDAASYYDGIQPGCGPCGCNPAAGGSCQPGAVRRYEETWCGSQMGGAVTSSDGSCVSVMMLDQDQAQGYEVDPSTPTGGACEPMIPAKPELVPVVICTLEHPMSGNCPAGSTCVPDGNGDTGNVCALLPGEGASCPDGYPSATTLFTSRTDNRVCACTCSSPSGACPGAQIVLRDTAGCNGAVMATVPADGNCHNVSAHIGHDGYEVEAGTWNGTCTPSDNHSGEVDFSGPYTLCCTV